MIDFTQRNLNISNEQRLEITALIGQAVTEVDLIIHTEKVDYSEDNKDRQFYEKRKYTMKDAKQNAKHAARLLRQAWEIIDPSLYQNDH